MMPERIDEDQSDGVGISITPPPPDDQLWITVDEAMYAISQIISGEWEAVDALAVLREAGEERSA